MRPRTAKVGGGVVNNLRLVSGVGTNSEAANLVQPPKFLHKDPTHASSSFHML